MTNGVAAAARHQGSSNGEHRRRHRRTPCWIHPPGRAAETLMDVRDGSMHGGSTRTAPTASDDDAYADSTPAAASSSATMAIQHGSTTPSPDGFIARRNLRRRRCRLPPCDPAARLALAGAPKDDAVGLAG
ncbi:uncharacterized protein LOC110433308 [Sorghum bicolor]|uniref:uncharacterized protein LOC110433308 n=1 Tax=Sorghum bicolor TaxID=4558 RepID=UPI000B425D0F|nr:uncharacterized protein LOC110433308 [Sorghum bicolor]|eukprot:XP_021310818.1 uncharacterized protein LOC110433308 [Sorghum bicolor]